MTSKQTPPKETTPSLPYGHPMCFMICAPTELHDATINFYKEIFGWNIFPISTFQPPEIANQPKSEHEAEFGFLFEAQKWGGGFVKTNRASTRSPKTEADAGAVVYYHVKDVDETLEKIEKAGGRRVGEKKVTGGVAMALFEDVAGNLQGISAFVGSSGVTSGNA